MQRWVAVLSNSPAGVATGQHKTNLDPLRVGNVDANRDSGTKIKKSTDRHTVAYVGHTKPAQTGKDFKYTNGFTVLSSVCATLLERPLRVVQSRLALMYLVSGNYQCVLWESDAKLSKMYVASLN